MYKKYLAELHFDYSKKIYKEKAQFLHKFTKRMSIEIEGNIVSNET